MTLLSAYWRYFLYVTEHKLNVLIECWHEGLYAQGLLHDLSKFCPQEFIPYAIKFYAGRKDEDTELRWKNAWLHHQNHNKHHWEYWIVNRTTKEALPMPQKYFIEMVCDWRSFSRKWGRRVKDSNLAERMMNSEDVILHPMTREALMQYLLER
ncbi:MULTISPECIES: DUF5662 family protein [Paenibacillus]|uniref:DUF5662 family protein n=1 Tax=Paenibacillus TaxID=44249 RepID=UPI001B3FAD8B|nr:MULTISPECIES: DUF5662 family protein [unclassified Paenibacillus]MDQ0721063.1 hypothetical protein [Paenibacillus sp. W4I10]QZN73705.1 DUF5662 family protein [Paenibacillus sp. DR312]